MKTNRSDYSEECQCIAAQKEIEFRETIEQESISIIKNGKGVEKCGCEEDYSTTIDHIPCDPDYFMPDYNHYAEITGSCYPLYDKNGIDIWFTVCKINRAKDLIQQGYSCSLVHSYVSRVDGKIKKRVLPLIEPVLDDINSGRIEKKYIKDNYVYSFPDDYPGFMGQDQFIYELIN